MLKIIIPLTLISFTLIGCGSSSKSKKTIDIADYLPSEATTKTYLQTIKSKDDEQERNTFTEEISSEGKTISIKMDNNLKYSYTIHDETITKKEYSDNTNSIDMKRFLSKGSTLYTIERSTHNEDITINKVIVGNRSVESKKNM